VPCSAYICLCAFCRSVIQCLKRKPELLTFLKKPAKMNYDIEKLEIAQITSSQLGEELTKLLEDKASFIDTDDRLNEFMVSTGTIAELCSQVFNTKLHRLCEQVKDYGYLHVTKI
jgi:hypothetical protein